MPTLSRIFIYPIKSTAPLELSHATVTPRGLQHDRRYLVTDTEGRFLTARRFPRLVLVRATIDGTGLQVDAPEMDTLHLQPDRFAAQYSGVTVWKDTLQAQSCSSEADQWFSDYLGIAARLVYMGSGSVRPARGGGEVSFADASPLMVLSEASVETLNRRLAKPVSVRNFRPNLVVAGVAAHGEDQWGEFGLGSARFRALWPCARCILTTVDPQTGHKDPDRQPLATLLQYRKVGGEALFGVNVGVLSAGDITCGDPLV